MQGLGVDPSRQAASRGAAALSGQGDDLLLTSAGSGSFSSELRRSLAKKCVTIAPSSAMPKTPPTSRLAFDVAEAMPARRRGTAFITAAVIGAIVRPMPMPIMSRFHHSALYGMPGVMRSISSMPTPTRARPTVMGTRGPMRPAMLPASGAVKMIAPVIGSERRPIWKAE